ncbi:MFS transporter [Rhodococcoides navarretei]|uniref:MFS transporter n=1 Tax=Rhodococcus navarretei TaxID=3128981 RepID=A0ABU9CQ59_9NOCA
MSEVVVSARTTEAVRATYIAFIGAGFAFASWASRIPQVRDRLELTSSQLGIVLLAIAVGSLLALPLSGIIINRFGSRLTVTVMSLVLAVGLTIIASGYLVGVVPLLIGLFVLGFANGAWDVAMNVHGAVAERRLGRSIMPRFHAGFSAGTVAGALIGTAMVALNISVTVHLLAVAAAVVVVIPWGVRNFLNESEAEPAEPVADSPRSNALARWKEPRTLLIGVVALSFAFAEGSGNDWLNVASIDGYDASAVVGTLVFTTFLVAMTAVRWFGNGLLDRYGRVVVLRGLAGVSVVGVLLFVLSPVVPLAFVGAFLWGAGVSLGFPVAMSAAADEPAAAAARVSVVASIGYFAFLGGPPLIGFLGGHGDVLRALLVVAALLAGSLILIGALRPLPGSNSRH